MKTRIILLTGILLLIGELSAQNKSPRFSKEDVIARKWEFVLQNTQMTADDILKVEPLFKESELATWTLIGKNRAVHRNSRQKDANAEVNFEPINEAIINFEIESAQIQKNYYLKLKNVVTPDVINRLLMAEKNFKRELMKKTVERKKNSNQPPK